MQLGIDPTTDTYLYQGWTYRIPKWGEYRQLVRDVKQLVDLYQKQETVEDIDRVHEKVAALLDRWIVEKLEDKVTPEAAVHLAAQLPGALVNAENEAKKKSVSSTPSASPSSAST